MMESDDKFESFLQASAIAEVQGRHADGAGLAEQAQVGAIESQNVHRQAVCLINQAEVLRTLGEFALSLAASDEATALTKAYGLENLQMGSELEAADTLLVMNQPHEALARLLRLAPCLAVADGVDRVHYWRAMADSHRAVADYKSALEAFEQHHQLVLAQVPAANMPVDPFQPPMPRCTAPRRKGAIRWRGLDLVFVAKYCLCGFSAFALNPKDIRQMYECPFACSIVCYCF